MGDNRRSVRASRWILSIALAVTGLGIAWAWGHVAQSAEPVTRAAESQMKVLYAAWQVSEDGNVILNRSLDGGITWHALALPGTLAPVVWAGDGGDRVAVGVETDDLLYSENRGDSWVTVAFKTAILSLAWGQTSDGRDSLFVGTDGQGVYRLESDGRLAALGGSQQEISQASVRHLALADGRLFAATRSALFHTDDGATWVAASPAPGQISALVAIDRETVLVGTEAQGVHRSADAGQTWEPASEGLGEAAGQYVQITALDADVQEPGVFYAAVGYLSGSAQLHFSAAGIFVTTDGATSWQPLAGPSFPEAKRTTQLVIAPGKPLLAQAVTASGLQLYAPDLAGAIAALEDGDAKTRQQAARMLALVRSETGRQALGTGQTVSQVEEAPVTAARSPGTWALALNRLQVLRWIVLALSMAGAAWLAIASSHPSLDPAHQHVNRRQASRNRL
jgi:hypothetical protein